MSINEEEIHGGIDFQELNRLGIDPKSILDFSSNILTCPPSPRVKEAIAGAEWNRYPDRECTYLRMALATHHQVDPELLLVGNGCSELIHLVAAELIQPGDRVVVLEPTFSEYRRAAHRAGATVHNCALPILESDDSRSNLGNTAVEEQERVLRVLDRYKPHLFWFCNPNNPTGSYTDVGILRKWIDANPGTLFVIDESYLDFVAGGESLIGLACQNLIVLRSMTKLYGLAGLRLGYLYTNPASLKRLKRRRIPWSVNAFALEAGTAAIQDHLYYLQQRTQRLRDLSQLVLGLKERGIQTIPTDTNYFLTRIGNPDETYRFLLRNQILVRKCNSFGLSHFLRIAARHASQNERFLEAIDRLEERTD
jgi:histidinol-phosphate aminotransferase